MPSIGAFYSLLLLLLTLIVWLAMAVRRKRYVDVFLDMTQVARSALQTLHKVSSKAREHNYFLGGLSHDWVSYYEQRIESDRSCLNEWHAMDNLESRRPPSPDSVRNKPREREETERVIRSTLKEIMMSVDLDEVTSKYIRGRLEEDLDMDLGEFKSFIDQEMLTILGQMDAPTEIFDHVYLGSEWNASNLEELQKNGVRHILNVTREIDNFFPGMFNYLNVRVYDDEKTDLLKHWDDTFKYISKAKKEGSKVLVHCKMGVSRSASVVIAYAMKAYNWDFSQALKHVKEKRNCIKPNNSFLMQLETYQGILDAMKNKEKLQRSKSDTNLKSPNNQGSKERVKKEDKKALMLADGADGTPVEVDDDDDELEEVDVDDDDEEELAEERSGAELKKAGQRPKSWSPNAELTEDVLPPTQLSQSLENIEKTPTAETVPEQEVQTSETSAKTTSPTSNCGGKTHHHHHHHRCTSQTESRNVLMPCDNGQSYSVSQNQIVHLPGPESTAGGCACKHDKLQDPGQGQKRKGLVLNLTNQFEAASSKPSSPSSETEQQQQRPSGSPVIENGCCGHEESANESSEMQTQIGECLVWTASAEVKFQGGKAAPKKEGDPFSTQLDRVFEREERREPPQSQQQQQQPLNVVRESPSRQSSWSSYDSAVVMDNNSVHSSWATLPSRNSSWGSYDMRPGDSLGSSGIFPYDREEIPWHPGTVKRTKQKLEENSTGTSKRVCTQSEQTGSDKPADAEAETTTVLLHYNSSPTPPRRRDPSPDNNQQIQRTPPSRGAAPIDITSTSSARRRAAASNANAAASGRLSTSAPAPSSLSSSGGSGDAELGTPSLLRACKSESETSSPSVVDTPQCPSVKHHKMVLENLTMGNKPIFRKSVSVGTATPTSATTTTTATTANTTEPDSPESECPPRGTSSGIVKNLKKEFEAKSSSRSPEGSSDANQQQQQDNNSCSSGGRERQKRDAKQIRSLPSSPVIPHNESKIQASPSMGGSEATRASFIASKRCSEPPMSRTSPSSEDDLSVRVLVGKYEVSKPARIGEVQLRTTSVAQQQQQHNNHHQGRGGEQVIEHPPAKSRIAPDFARRSAPMIINHHAATAEAPGRPPSVPSPSQVVESVIAKAASRKQQQHGRTHPLARLQVRPRHSSPVYNTM